MKQRDKVKLSLTKGHEHDKEIKALELKIAQLNTDITNLEIDKRISSVGRWLLSSLVFLTYALFIDYIAEYFHWHHQAGFGLSQGIALALFTIAFITGILRLF